MATNRWTGRSLATAQVDTLTIGGTIEVGDLFLVTIGGKTFSYAATSTAAATVASGFATAWNALSSTYYPEFAEMTAAATSGGALTLTADTPGKPFTVSVSTTESNGGASDGQTFSRAATTASSGPNHWDTAANWSLGTVPVSTDDVWIENSSVSILYGLAQSAVTLTSLNIAASFTGEIGLKENTGTYIEYRDRFLAISATTVNIGDGFGSGSGRIQLDFGANAATVNVRNMGTPAENGLEALLIKGSSITAVNADKGSVGIAVFAGESATVTTLRSGYRTNPTSDVTIRCGPSVTLTTLEQSGGTVELGAGLTTITKTDGTLTVKAGNITTANIDGGAFYYHGVGTITTLNASDGGIVDFSQNMRGRTVTTGNFYSGSSLIDSFRTVTFTNPVRIQRCALADLKRIDLGTHIALAITAGP